MRAEGKTWREISAVTGLATRTLWYVTHHQREGVVPDDASLPGPGGRDGHWAPGRMHARGEARG